MLGMNLPGHEVASLRTHKAKRDVGITCGEGADAVAGQYTQAQLGVSRVEVRKRGKEDPPHQLSHRRNRHNSLQFGAVVQRGLGRQRRGDHRTYRHQQFLTSGRERDWAVTQQQR